MSRLRLPLQVLDWHLSPLEAAMQGFILDRQAAGCAPKTIVNYRYVLGYLVSWLQHHGATEVSGITPRHLRGYLVHLRRRGLKASTVHAHARGIKAWLNWLVREGDLGVSPMRNVAMPRLERRIPPPFSPLDVRKLLAACERRTAIGARNYAIVLTLLDTGLRAAEFLSLRLGDVDMRSGLATVVGKGHKMRQVRVGSRARSAVLRMLGFRGEVHNGDPLWIGYNTLLRIERGGLGVGGLQASLKRLGQKAGVMPANPHRFRRTFALWCLRDGMDLHSLRMLMGHSSLAVLQRYLALAGEDIERAHKAHSPVDRLLERR